jgi:alkylation response protein AidB-like acyl-CoA dehydrogenase
MQAYANERVHLTRQLHNLDHRSKLADMATSCYAEKVLLQSSKDIEDRIIAQAEGMFQEAELKVLKNMLLNVLYLKWVSEDVQNCADEGIQILVEWDSEDTHGSALRDARIARIYEGTNEINRMLL